MLTFGEDLDGLNSGEGDDDLPHDELLSVLCGKLILPGDDPGGFIVTILIGMAGALVGGLIVGLLGGTGVTGFNIWSILVATVGAIVLLAVYRLWRAP